MVSLEIVCETGFRHSSAFVIAARGKNVNSFKCGRRRTREIYLPKVAETGFEIRSDILSFSLLCLKVANKGQQKLDLQVVRVFLLRHNFVPHKWFIDTGEWEIYLAAVIEFMERFASWNFRSCTLASLEEIFTVKLKLLLALCHWMDKIVLGKRKSEWTMTHVDHNYS